MWHFGWLSIMVFSFFSFFHRTSIADNINITDIDNIEVTLDNLPSILNQFETETDSDKKDKLIRKIEHSTTYMPIDFEDPTSSLLTNSSYPEW